MIAAIPSKHLLDFMADSYGVKRQPSNFTEFQDLLLQELELHSHSHRTRAGATCLSCGAKTNAAGELPCGH